MSKIQIEQIQPSLTWRIRHEAMYPDMPYDSVKLDNDDDGIHFGLYADGQLSSVVSLFEQGDTYQFRKFATLPEAQGKGYGSQLLAHLIAFIKKTGAKKIWCNARVNAASFYAKFGFQKTDTTFFQNGFDFVIMELELYI
ncbi:N-acetyltransferase [Pedobacter sp. HMWF019]|uniref:GNAT family N-acetyltransferase n=1 Tax=Pedobacter sp. HMWF019 TaxID=2056856 RepID=UPI000D3B1B35|nr:GNAT family N-acetyltransferase [Pedobacter sp. HMWF019]PTS94877.1 N-acetyltransferase [Pedobacter sp. HMWF019]